MAQDVSVSDVTEIRTFESSIDHFGNDYSRQLDRVVSDASSDESTIDRLLDNVRQKKEKAERELQQAERELQAAQSWESSGGGGGAYWQNEAHKASRKVEQKRAALQQATRQLQEAENLASQLKSKLRNAADIASKGSRDIRRHTDDAVRTISAARDKIEQYLNKR